MPNTKTAAEIFAEMEEACYDAKVDAVAAALMQMLAATYNVCAREGYVDALLVPLQRMVTHISANVARAASADAGGPDGEEDPESPLPGESPPAKKVMH